MELNRVHQIQDRIAPRRALVSVADKTGLEDLVAGLWHRLPALEVFSTGGTYRLLATVAEDLKATHLLRRIDDYTGQPEMQGGLVKTLDYRIYLGLLGEQFNPAHQKDLERSDAVAFDLTVCNFYPFEATAGKPDTTVEDLRTHIDIGGPTMVRASAKNFLRVAVLTSPQQYPDLLEHLDAQNGTVALSWRAARAAEAFRYTAHYEAAIAGVLGSHIRSVDLSAVYQEDKRG